MGASDSQPTETPRVESNEVEQKKDGIYSINIHEEVTYDECNLETKKKSSLPPSYIFEIVVCHPQYFCFANDIIRQCIREQSKIDTKKNQKEYNNIFSSSDKMENSRNKILEHFKLKDLNQQYLKNMPIQINFESNPELVNNRNDPIINFQGILKIMKNQWATNNKKTIESFISNLQILSFKKSKPDKENIRNALSKIMKKNILMHLFQII